MMIVFHEPDLLDLGDLVEPDTTEHRTEIGTSLGDRFLGSTNSRTPLNYANDATSEFSMPMPAALAADHLVLRERRETSTSRLDAPSCVNIPSIAELNVQDQDSSDSTQTKS
jgi:hypothetical protein